MSPANMGGLNSTAASHQEDIQMFTSAVITGLSLRQQSLQVSVEILETQRFPAKEERGRSQKRSEMVL